MTKTPKETKPKDIALTAEALAIVIRNAETLAALINKPRPR